MRACYREDIFFLSFKFVVFAAVGRSFFFFFSRCSLLFFFFFFFILLISFFSFSCDVNDKDSLKKRRGSEKTMSNR